MIPEDVRYTVEHEWVRLSEAGTVTFGITHHAQDALGDIVYLDLPGEGARIEAGSACGEIESTKSVSEIYAPVSGTVVRRNDALVDAPESINADPYGAGWMVEVQPDPDVDVQALLDAEAYRALLDGQ